MKRVLVGGFVAASLVACTIYNVGSSTRNDSEGRQGPNYVIGIVCSQGVANGGECTSDYECCSGHCCFGCSAAVPPPMGICIGCQSNFDCMDPMFPVCNLSSNSCVASGTQQCSTLGEDCLTNSCCPGMGLKCDMVMGTCQVPVADSGSGG